MEEEERNEKGRVIGTIYKQVQEEGPRRVATISNGNDAEEFAAVKRGLKAFKARDAAHTRALTHTDAPSANKYTSFPPGISPSLTWCIPPAFAHVVYPLPRLRSATPRWRTCGGSRAR